MLRTQFQHLLICAFQITIALGWQTVTVYSIVSILKEFKDYPLA